jgi:hypothetical protein
MQVRLICGTRPVIHLCQYMRRHFAAGPLRSIPVNCPEFDASAVARPSLERLNGVKTTANNGHTARLGATSKGKTAQSIWVCVSRSNFINQKAQHGTSVLGHCAR